MSISREQLAGAANRSATRDEQTADGDFCLHIDCGDTLADGTSSASLVGRCSVYLACGVGVRGALLSSGATGKDVDSRGLRRLEREAAASAAGTYR
ncbi:hypothetical protein P9239_07625 [Caballeronia sp. LZ062]|uniref:hypothetical protein n=1 Tax=unclassified Caballeronia TaxID=2646786 RepID=UPI002855095F|nr:MULTISPECIES: hypothetical protein [unclassified Caballeronia]MDR5855248.1 hypothetical protein [Caballeronia sp. LZ050]MDR5870223.1 hypothetical protein [Caballeronia sp. LZ062]